MRGRRISKGLLPVVPVVILLGVQQAGAQGTVHAARVRLEPVAGKTLAGEVMSVHPAQRTLVVRIAESGGEQRDVSITLDNGTVLKKLPTPVSGGDLSPGHLVEVASREEAGRLVAQRIEVTGKRVHERMP